jgi:capsular polysaccharide transport system permease protein
VEVAEHDAKAAVLAVSNYRNAKSVFDPEKQSGLQLAQVEKMQDELIATREQIADLDTVAKSNPQLPVLRGRTVELETDIASELGKVAGSELSLSTKSAGYEGLILERDFASKRLEIALSLLEQSRANALKQQLYLERIAQPNRPDVAIEPHRIRDVVATFLVSLLVWGIISLLVTAVKEHAS